MRYLRTLLALFFAAGFPAGLAAAQSAVPLFDYDAKQPLDIHDEVIEEFSSGTLHEIAYTSAKGGPVGAYLVVPKGKGPFAAILRSDDPGMVGFRKTKPSGQLEKYCQPLLLQFGNYEQYFDKTSIEH